MATTRRKRLVARVRPTLVCATLAGTLITAKNITEDSLEKLRESRGLRRPKLRAVGIGIPFETFKDLRIGDYAWDADFGHLTWNGREWV